MSTRKVSTLFSITMLVKRRAKGDFPFTLYELEKCTVILNEINQNIKLFSEKQKKKKKKKKKKNNVLHCYLKITNGSKERHQRGTKNFILTFIHTTLIDTPLDFTDGSFSLFTVEKKKEKKKERKKS